MRIILIRHGESEGNADPSAYPRTGDPQIGLTERGWGQAFKAGQFLRGWYVDQGDTHKTWPAFTTSSFTRAQQTTAAILAGMSDAFPGEPQVTEDKRLVEQSLGYLAYASSEKSFLTRAFARTLHAMSQRVYKHSPFIAPPLFGEAPMSSNMRVDSLIKDLKADIASGAFGPNDDRYYVCHGATKRHVAMNFFNLPLAAFRQIKNPGNADIWVIEEKNGAWQLERIYNGVNGTACSEHPIAGIEPLSFKTLPRVPDFLRPL